MAKAKLSWREKFARAEEKGLPKVIRCDKLKGQTMLIPSPREVEALMRKVPAGKLVTITELRDALARRHDADITCPFTTGIFAWIVAQAAAEGASPAPYWRTLKTGGELNPKYPGGVAGLRKKLAAEGHEVVKKGTRYFVADLAAALARIK